MDKHVEMAWLLDFYGPLLTPRQQELLRLYCDEDLSLAEIAAQEEISRQGVYDTVHRATHQLEAYEKQLGLLERYRRLTRGLLQCKKALVGVSPMPGSEQALHHALSLLDEMIEQEQEG